MLSHLRRSVALLEKPWLLPPQAVLRVCSDTHCCSGTPAPQCRVFPLLAAPQRLGHLGCSFPISLSSASASSPPVRPPAQPTLPPGGFGDRSPLSRPESHRDHFPLSLTSGNPRCSQLTCTGGMGEQPPLWGAGMGTDLSLGWVGAPQGTPNRGESRGTAAAPSSFLILLQNRSAQAGEDVTKIASPWNLLNSP